MFDRRKFLSAFGAVAVAAPVVANPVFDPELRRHAREVTKNLLAGRFEPMDSGELDLRSMKAKVGGYFRHWVERADMLLMPPCVETNLVVDTGIDRIMQSGLSAYVGYLGLFENDVTVEGDLAVADVPDTLGEFTNYTQANRVAWTKDAYADGTYVNAGTPALFTMDTGGGDVWGAFLTSNNGKSATTGTFVAAKKFDAERTGLLVGDKLYIEYGITLTPA